MGETFTSIKGKFSKLERTINGFDQLISGKHDGLSESSLYMIGDIEEAILKEDD